MLPGLDIIVVNHKTPEDLDEFCFSFYANQPSVPWNLWIANVAPDEQDRKVANHWIGRLDQGSEHTIFHENIGYGKAVNECASYGNRSVIAAFNADVVLRDRSLDECYKALISEESWGVLGPRQKDDQNLLTHAGIFGPDDAPAHRGWHEVDTGQYQDIKEAYSVSGSAYFVKRTVWEELTVCSKYREVVPDAKGAFLPVPLLYYEETFCSVHARSHGWQSVYLGTVTVLHKWHRSIQKNGGEHSWAASKELFVRACQNHEILHD